MLAKTKKRLQEIAEKLPNPHILIGLAISLLLATIIYIIFVLFSNK